ncbi:MAG: hypothetical protein JSR18_03145 [Proteobacteria bacterium]|nr:hypothetical protein [Pseudomonadota bacterium]
MDTRYAFPPSTAAAAGSNLYRRLDEIEMSAAERERAKRDLRAAEETVAWIASAFAQLRSWFGAPRTTAHAR